MKAKVRLRSLALGIAVATPTPAWADNPIVQTSYTADPAPMVHEGRLYLYTSHDEDVTVKDFYTMNDWRLYSTVDMVNWTDHGTPAGLKTFNWSTDSAWAPQGVARNGKFYLYVPINNNTGAKIGVAVANTPLGPFMDPLGKALAANGSSNIDPTVFVDDDGQAYMYWGNGTLRYVKLNSDMISTSGSVTNVALNGFTEGPWFYKRGSLYYMVYAATSGSEKLSYATSDKPTGPWTIRGDIMAPGNTFTNHPGVVDYKGHSYFFYHNSALPGGNNYKRSVCVEEFTYGADGSIPKLKMSANGPTAIAALNPFQQVEGETIAFSSGLKTEVSSAGGIDVTKIDNGDYIKVKNVNFGSGATSFDARVASSTSGGSIELHLDSQTGTLLGTCAISGTGGAQMWTTKTCPVTGAMGVHDLFFKFTGGSGNLFSFDWWQFSGPGSMDQGSGGTGAGGGSSGGAGTNGGAGGQMSKPDGGSVGVSGGSANGGSGGSVAGDSGGTPPSAGGSGSGTINTGGKTGAGGSMGAVNGGTGGNGTKPAEDDGGCSCRAAGASTGWKPGLALLGLLSVVVLRRRRSTRASR